MLLIWQFILHGCIHHCHALPVSVGHGMCWTWYVLDMVCVGHGMCWTWYVLDMVCVVILMGLFFFGSLL